MGAVALPLFTQFGPEALEHRLRDSGARALVTDGENLPKIDAIASILPELQHIFVVERENGAHVDFWEAVQRASPNFTPVDTASEDPALIIYTSGTTGKPKGALHGHRVLLGHIPGVQFPHEFFPQPGDKFWTPADWAWAGGLLDALLPSLYFGIPVVAHRARKFDPEHAFHFISKHKVRNAFMPPTALKLMRQVTNGGYRIGPTDIEDCILAHPAVLLVAVVGVPDAIWGEIVKAFIVPGPGIAAGPALADEIQAFVRDRLAAYQYRRAVEFVDSLPMTATGKIMRRTLRERATGVGKAQPSPPAKG
jgi:acyl-coenzyme A synthetase/AMP-(fatty) acid ligase